MNADEFIEAVESLPPSREQFEQVITTKYKGDEFAKLVNALIEGFYFKRKNAEPGTNGVDPLIDLIRRYDMTTFESCGIMFLDAPIEIDGGIQIGDEQSMPLVIEPARGEIVVLEYGEDTVIGRCGKDGAHFLDALLLLVGLHKLHVANEVNKFDGANRDDLVERCTMAAGGWRYHAFYKAAVQQ